MIRIFLAVILVCVAGGAQAQRVSKVNGTRLLKLCSSKTTAPPPGKSFDRNGTVEVEKCDIYLSGVADAMAEQPAPSRVACIPPAVTSDQLREVAVKLMRDHPEKLQLSAAEIATHAFAEAFSCKK